MAGGEITLGATRKAANDDEGIEIWVSDTGIGIAPADIAKALAPFGQVRTNVNTAQQGTGLGLPITKSLTELNGGRFEIQSAPGKGTRVSIHFPRAKIAAFDRIRTSAAGDGIIAFITPYEVIASAVHFYKARTAISACVFHDPRYTPRRRILPEPAAFALDRPRSGS